MAMLGKRLLAATAASLLGLGWFLGTGAGDETAPVQQEAKPVVAVSVAPVSNAGAIRLAGEIRAKRQARLSFTVAGRIEGRAVSAGDAVSAGEVLAVLDPVPFELQVTQAEAAVRELDAHLGQAKRELMRNEALQNREAVSLERLDAVRSAAAAYDAAREQASSRLAEARRAQAEAVLAAPFDGVVTSVALESGEYAQPGQEVLALSSRDTLEFHAGVPEHLLGTLRPGQAVELLLPLVGTRLGGQVKQIGYAADGRRLYPVTVVLAPDQAAIPGMAAELLLPRVAGAALSLPLAAVRDPVGAGPVVWVVRDGRAEAVAVTVHALQGGWVQADAPLAPGEEVILAGHGGLVPGAAVEVVR